MEESQSSNVIFYCPLPVSVLVGMLITGFEFRVISLFTLFY